MSAYTLIEMLTTVAVLVIVLGLMVSLARHVRERAAVALTKDLLRRLDQAVAQYAARHDGKLPPVTPFPPVLPTREAAGPGPLPATTGPAAQAAKPRRRRDADADYPDRRVLEAAALANNHDFVAVLKADAALGEGREPGSAAGGKGGGVAGSAGVLGDVPVSMYDETTLRDAWGSPIVFMPAKHPWVGTAPRDRFFFFSAGPDRHYLTQDDNLYSYEEAGR